MEDLKTYFARRKRKQGDKYHSSGCRCKLNHYHMSIGEANYCNKLLLRKKAGDIKGFATQVTYPLFIAGKLICNHVVDFVIHLKNGTDEIHEYKGFMTQVWLTKKKMFEACYPSMKYKVIYANKRRGIA